MDEMWTRMGRLLAAALAVAVLVGLGTTAGAQVTSGSTEQERLLEVRRQQVELRSARADLQRVQKLHASGLVSDADLERAEVAVERSQLAYQEALLSLLNVQPRITVTEAMKFRSESGEQFCRITLRNLTPSLDDSQFALLGDFDGDQALPDQLRKRDVRDIYVSLKDASEGGDAAYGGSRSTTIGLPYEKHVEELPYGESVTMVFQLLRDVSSVVVSIGSRGQQRDIDLELQNAEGERDVIVHALQVSQEADLGAEVTFPLRLERSTVDVRQFQLAVRGLPPAVGYQFLEPSGGSRISQASFPAGVNRLDLQLRLFLPDRPTAGIAIDQPLELWAVAFEEGAETGTATSTPSEDAVGSRAGTARLELVPRGVGEIDVRASALLLEGVQGQPLETTLRVRNSGTRRLDNVRFQPHSPPDWRTSLEPQIIDVLEVGEEREISLRLEPPAEVPVGDYELRVETESLSFNRTVSAEDKTFRVRIQSDSNLLGLTLLTFAIGTLLVGGVFFGVRLTRR